MNGWTVVTGFLLTGILHLSVSALRHHDRATPVGLRALRAIGGAGLLSMAWLAAGAGMWTPALVAAAAGLPLALGLVSPALWARLRSLPRPALARSSASARRLGPTP